VQDRAIAGEEGRIEMLCDCGDVKRLIADAVAVSAAVENGNQAERQAADSECAAFEPSQASILLDQMTVVTPDGCARAVVSIGFCEVVWRPVHQPSHTRHDDLAHVPRN
jgi:hypothetical protein